MTLSRQNKKWPAHTRLTVGMKIPYIGNHPRKKSFANYLLYHSLQEKFTIQAISYIKIPRGPTPN